VGVTDIPPDNRALSAEFAAFCHDVEACLSLNAVSRNGRR
jgi:hypothetical protein